MAAMPPHNPQVGIAYSETGENMSKFNTNISINVDPIDNGFIVTLNKSQYDPKAYGYDYENEAAEAPKPINFRGFCADEAAVDLAIITFLSDNPIA